MGLRWGALIVAVVLGVLGSSAPASAAGITVQPFPFVSRVWPQGQVTGTQPTLLIDFSVPMSTRDVAVRLTPAADFWWYWETPQQLVIEPKVPLRPATSYRVSISGRSQYGAQLHGQTVYSFTTRGARAFDDGPHVLTYHINGHPRPGEIAENFVSWESFERQLDELTELGYTFGTLDSGCRGRIVCLTFDDGWATQFTAAQVLAARGIPATFFVTVDLIGRPAFMGWGQVRALSALGMTVGSHLLDHDCLSASMHALSAAQKQSYLDAQLGRSQQQLRAWTGQTVRYVAYPYGCFDWQVIKATQRYYDGAWTTERTMPLDAGMARFARTRSTVLEDTHFTSLP